MKAMGWTEGEGLGKESHGDVNPLMITIKTDKRGRSTILPFHHHLVDFNPIHNNTIELS